MKVQTYLEVLNAHKPIRCLECLGTVYMVEKCYQEKLCAHPSLKGCLLHPHISSQLPTFSLLSWRGEGGGGGLPFL